jgi:hypothetical protein
VGTPRIAGIEIERLNWAHRKEFRAEMAADGGLV